MPQLEHPVLSVDVVLLQAERSRLLVSLQRRTKPPFLNAWALPGVAVRYDETLEAAARRALSSKAGFSPEQIRALHLEQVATFDALFRDPRGRTVSVAYLGLSAEHLSCAPAARMRWTEVKSIARGSLPFDHEEILQTTVERLRGKLRYTNIAARLLPETFQLEELQCVYEAILGRPLNRSNFRTKLLKIGVLERAGEQVAPVGSQGGRPPHLYRFSAQDIEAQDREFV